MKNLILLSSLLLLTVESSPLYAKVVIPPPHEHMRHFDKSKSEKLVKKTNISKDTEKEHHILYAHLVMLLR
ncbi:hypothetical protein PLESHI_09974 [Plesiomonas shigelloides 302-73]|uniref:Uncharacterized protein n=1 Tax=Plesiomonas shigelloides 302-73 TaxID=1315976 RepID=R8AQG7_PLESH|nr:hypothetical protein PLESHI_09974 [Plesiomonas shigelloides 302-73]